MAGKQTEAFQTCWTTLAQNKSKVKAKSGKTAVIYAGGPSSGPLWQTLEARQHDYLKRMGVEAPFTLVTDALDDIPVKLNGNSMSLNDAMSSNSLMLKDETSTLWDEASRLWALNNNKVFVWRGTVAPEKRPIFDRIELPLQLLRNKKLTPFNTRQIQKALAQIRKGKPLEAELIEAEKEFRDLADALAARNQQLRVHGFRDTHPELAKLVM